MFTVPFIWRVLIELLVFVSAPCHVVHREFPDRRERAGEKVRGRRPDNQTEQEEAQTIADAYVATA